MHCLEKRRIVYAKFDTNRRRLYLVTKFHRRCCNTQTFYNIILMNVPKREFVCLQSLSNDKKEVIKLAHKMAKNNVNHWIAPYIVYDWLCEQY